MKAETLKALLHELPQSPAFLYYPDRESPWLMARQMDACARVGALKTGPLARYLDRPLVKPVVAACGGTLSRADLDAVAFADRTIDRPHSRAAAAGIAAAFEAPWFDFEVSFAAWTSNFLGFASAQMSRPGANLVLQLGFTPEDVEMLNYYVGADQRHLFEYDLHPVRSTGRPTLAWVRIDVEGKVALIEEIQSDWLRFTGEVSKTWARTRPNRHMTHAMKIYHGLMRERYEAIWPRAALLAALAALRMMMGVREVYMHQPKTGMALKGITGRPPPRSLYSQLPRSFGFRPTSKVPPLLGRRHRRRLAPFRRAGEPAFWHLSL